MSGKFIYIPNSLFFLSTGQHWPAWASACHPSKGSEPFEGLKMRSCFPQTEIHPCPGGTHPGPMTHQRSGSAIANQNTLIYILINLRFLQRIRNRQTTAD